MKDNLTPERVFSEFEHGEGYNRRIELYETPTTGVIYKGRIAPGER